MPRWRASNPSSREIPSSNSSYTSSSFSARRANRRGRASPTFATGTSSRSGARKIFKLIPQLDEHGIDLLNKLLVYDPSKRIHATDALEHPYFDSLDKSQFAAIEREFEMEFLREKENRMTH